MQRLGVPLWPFHRRAALLAGCALALATWWTGATETQDPADAPVVTTLTAIALGHQRANVWLRAEHNRKPLLDAAARASASVVRVQCRYRSGDNESCERGTGAFVGAAGCVLTVGHVLTHFDDDAKLSVQLADGKELPAVVLGRGPSKQGGDVHDWALLQVAGDARTLPAPLLLGIARAGEDVVLLGFGGDAGLGSAGVVVPNRDGSVLTPTWLVARIDAVAGVFATPIAGSIPLGGFSGAPVVNAAGEVIAVQAAATVFRDETTHENEHGTKALEPPVLRHRVDCAALDGVAKLVPAAEPGGR